MTLLVEGTGEACLHLQTSIPVVKVWRTVHTVSLLVDMQGHHTTKQSIFSTPLKESVLQSQVFL